MSKYFTAAVYFIAAILIFMAGWKMKPMPVSEFPEAEYLQNGIVKISAAYKSQKELNRAMENEAAELKALLENKANIIAQLSALLQGNQFSGVAVPSVLNWSKYTADLAEVEYKGIPDSVKLNVFDRPVSVFLARDKAGKWTARIEDLILKKPAIISDINISELKLAWYKKINLGFGVGYFNGAFLIGAVGYDKMIFQPMLGYDNEVLYGGSVVRYLKAF